MPELIVNENSVFDVIKNDNNVWGCFWNEWQISWTGTPTYTLNNSTNTTGSQFADDPNLVIKGKLELEVEMVHKTDCLLMEHPLPTKVKELFLNHIFLILELDL